MAEMELLGRLEVFAVCSVKWEELELEPEEDDEEERCSTAARLLGELATPPAGPGVAVCLAEQIERDTAIRSWALAMSSSICAR